jgi:hypothetical protein
MNDLFSFDKSGIERIIATVRRMEYTAHESGGTGLQFAIRDSRSVAAVIVSARQTNGMFKAKFVKAPERTTTTTTTSTSTTDTTTTTSSTTVIPPGFCRWEYITDELFDCWLCVRGDDTTNALQVGDVFSALVVGEFDDGLPIVVHSDTCTAPSSTTTSTTTTTTQPPLGDCSAYEGFGELCLRFFITTGQSNGNGWHGYTTTLTETSPGVYENCLGLAEPPNWDGCYTKLRAVCSGPPDYLFILYTFGVEDCNDPTGAAPCCAYNYVGWTPPQGIAAIELETTPVLRGRWNAYNITPFPGGYQNTCYDTNTNTAILFSSDMSICNAPPTPTTTTSTTTTTTTLPPDTCCNHGAIGVEIRSLCPCAEDVSFCAFGTAGSQSWSGEFAGCDPYWVGIVAVSVSCDTGIYTIVLGEGETETTIEIQGLDEYFDAETAAICGVLSPFRIRLTCGGDCTQYTTTTSTTTTTTTDEGPP